ncbi:hypothetical protein CPB83DRAFT_862905 [Crepidotus variabilis]|uniref:Uncharacterized protein n=1 Tax=Crepidotus variabilis TaxID=179855 RepID=A0A9P6E6I3_9AGAR|nr:hypothetical protein CPB83DRAFT_862905 [Crepidotus variabilis]
MLQSHYHCHGLIWSRQRRDWLFDHQSNWAVASRCGVHPPDSQRPFRFAQGYSALLPGGLTDLVVVLNYYLLAQARRYTRCYIAEKNRLFFRFSLLFVSTRATFRSLCWSILGSFLSFPLLNNWQLPPPLRHHDFALTRRTNPSTLSRQVRGERWL